MKSLLICFCFIICQGSTFVKGKNYSGYIFSAEEFALVNIENQSRRFTPSEDDIVLVEKLIRGKIKYINTDKENQSGGCSNIHKKLKKYVRQYVGFINNNNEKVIWINFIWEGKIPNERLSKEVVQIFDGCSFYWNIKVNIEKRDIYDFNVNGRG